MKRIHIICTKNGLLNEGMNNIEAHFSKYWAKKYKISNSSIRDIFGFIKGVIFSDCTIFFTRATTKIYWLALLATILNKNIWLIIVQKVENGFIKYNNIKQLNCNYLYLSEDDVKNLQIVPGRKKIKFEVGINSEKFKPISKKNIINLKNKYGICDKKPLILHVGHASDGRGIEELAEVNPKKYERLFVDSGIFKNEEKIKYLKEHGVKIFTGYIECIEELYQMADAYFFPTKDGNYVISTPLSIMESLSCGTAAISYKILHVTSSIKNFEKDSITEIENINQLNSAIEKAVTLKREKTFLYKTYSWNEVAHKIEQYIWDNK